MKRLHFLAWHDAAAVRLFLDTLGIPFTRTGDIVMTVHMMPDQVVQLYDLARLDNFWVSITD